MNPCPPNEGGCGAKHRGSAVRGRFFAIASGLSEDGSANDRRETAPCAGTHPFFVTFGCMAGIYFHDEKNGENPGRVSLDASPFLFAAAHRAVERGKSKQTRL